MAPTRTNEFPTSPADRSATQSATPSTSRARRRPRLPNPCYNCISREIDCDGERPTCGPCSRFTHASNGGACSYNDPPVRTRNQVLQQRIRTLEDEIARLESQNMQQSATTVEHWLSGVESSGSSTSLANGGDLHSRRLSQTPPPPGIRHRTPPRSIHPRASGSPNSRSSAPQPISTSAMSGEPTSSRQAGGVHEDPYDDADCVTIDKR